MSLMPAKILCIGGEPGFLKTIVTGNKLLCFSVIIGENQASEARFGTLWWLVFA
jgi:hypothetical protein